MRKKIFFLLVAVVLSAACASAQTSYPSTDSDGNTVYYKLLSAYPDYANMCITDNSRKASTTGYNFLIQEVEEDSYVQEWMLVVSVDTAGEYYLRNRSTRRYISPAGTWKGDYYTPNYTSSKTAIKPYTLVDLKENQIAIKYNDGSNERYLFVADSAGTKPSFNEYGLENSVWAWKVCTRTGVPVSIGKIIKESNVKVTVENRVIRVEGTDSYVIVNDEGVQFPKHTVLQPGIYFVNANGIAYKVLVK